MGVAAVSAVSGGSSTRTAAVGASAPVLAASDADTDETATPKGSTPARTGRATGGAGDAGGAGASRPGSQVARQQVEDVDSAAALETSAYLQKLYMARAFGEAVDAGERPAEITPERMTGLVDYLQDQVAMQTAARPTPVVDVDA